MMDPSGYRATNPTGKPRANLLPRWTWAYLIFCLLFCACVVGFVLFLLVNFWALL